VANDQRNDRGRSGEAKATAQDGTDTAAEAEAESNPNSVMGRSVANDAGEKAEAVKTNENELFQQQLVFDIRSVLEKHGLIEYPPDDDDDDLIFNLEKILRQ